MKRAAAGLALAALCAAGCGAARQAGPAPRVLSLTAGAFGPGREVATGFAVGDGRVATVAHAVSGRPRVVLARGGSATVQSADARLDLALLRARGLRAPPLRTARARANDAVTVLVLRDGRARRLPATVTRVVTARVRAHPDSAAQSRPALELAASVLPGDSGAPVLDGADRVVGMVFARSAAAPARTYALDATALRDLP